MVSIAKIYGAIDRKLSIETETVDVTHNSWKFIRISDTTSGPLYRIYGDSLITEVWNGDRQWYSICRDSVLYLGSETRFHKVQTQKSLATSAFGNMWLAGNNTTDALGHYYHTLGMSQNLNYMCSRPISGEIILNDEYVLPAVAITETRVVTRHIINCDSFPDVELTTKKTVRTRWFIKGDHLPIAMQTSESEIIQDKELYSDTHTFILPLDRNNIDDKIRHIYLQNLLDNAEIKYDNGIIQIADYFPGNTCLYLYLSNLQGGVYHQKPIEVLTSNYITEIHLPFLPSGQYVITISAGTPTDRKIIINI